MKKKKKTGKITPKSSEARDSEGPERRWGGIRGKKKRFRGHTRRVFGNQQTV